MMGGATFVHPMTSQYAEMKSVLRHKGTIQKYDARNNMA